jgi:hypothetical protein
VRTTFELAADLHDAMEKAIIRDGYSRRKKSLWICEAISELKTRDPKLISVGLGEGNMTFDKVMGLSLTQVTLEQIGKLKATIRRLDPEAEGLNGQIIRAAIRARIGKIR